MLEAVTVQRAVAEVSIETDLRICVTPSNPVPANSLLTISYPSDQAIIQGQQVYQANGLALQVISSQSQTAVI